AAPAGTLSAPRRRVSHSRTAAAAVNMTGTPTSPNQSWTGMSPACNPSQPARPLALYAIAYAAVRGSSLIGTSVRPQAQLSGIRVRTSRVRVSDMAGGELIKFDVFFDYQCPFVYRAAGLLDAVRRSGQRNLDVGWRYFSLTQVNSKDDVWTVWGAPASEKVRGRFAFQAAEAARRQERFDEFHRGLLLARHRDRLEIDDVSVVEHVAAEAGLGIERFRRDVADPSILDALARDHR